MNERIALTVSGQQELASGVLRGVTEPVRSLYVHVPFCFHKCHYCDFYSIVDSGDRQGEFTDRLIEELRFLSGYAGPLRTIFVGGGTPTLLGVAHWRRLLDALDECFDLTDIRAGDGEFTVECNPETATAELMDVLVAGGVNRVSVGAQSFDERHLKTLERWHDPASVGRALKVCAGAGIARRSLDLIFGIPGQTLDEWAADLDVALGVDPALEHLSCYALTYEANTAMTKRLEMGEFVAASEDLEVAMYSLMIDKLCGAGLERYEVSNFARGDDARSRHNLAYWRNESWLAAGPAAAGHVHGRRWKNIANLREWLTGVAASGGASRVVDVELEDPARALCERIMMGIRIAEGLDFALLMEEAERLGVGAAMAEAVRGQVSLGYVSEDSGRVRLTEEGFLFADGVAGAMMGALA